MLRRGPLLRDGAHADLGFGLCSMLIRLGNGALDEVF